MRNEQLVLVAIFDGSHIAFVGTQSKGYELPTAELGRASLIEKSKDLAEQIGCISHSAVHYDGKRENQHIVWITVDEHTNYKAVRWETTDRIAMTESMRKMLSAIKEKARDSLQTA